MKCENCGTELVGAAIVCRQCNHNITQGRIGQWRAQRKGEQPTAQAAARTASPMTAPAVAPKPDIKRLPTEPASSVPSPPQSSQLSASPFDTKPKINHVAIPKSSAMQSSAVSRSSEDDSVVQFPAWRAQLKDKVKEVKERRNSQPLEMPAQPDEAQLDPNPIVESALKRIRWSQHPQPTQPAQSPTELQTPKSENVQGAKQVLKEESLTREEDAPDTNPFSRKEPRLEPKPVPRALPSSNNPLLARKPAAPQVSRTDSGPLSAPKTEPSQPLHTAFESRVEIKPATKSESKPGSGSLPAIPKIRTTGEIKKPEATERPFIKTPSGSLRTPSGSLAQPPSKPVATQVIGLAPSVSDLANQTPAGLTSSLKPRRATLWSRTLAGTCDFEVVAMAFLAIFWPYAVLNTSVGYESATILFILLASLMFCYQLLTLTIANRTTGMAFLRLRLVNAANKEKPVSFSQKFWRAVAATIAAFIPPLNFLVMQSNPQHRSLPDLVSGTTLLERVKAN